MNSVKERWALVTGASRGIGSLVALFMAKQGCNLVVHSRRLEHTDRVLQEVKALGVEAYAVQAELAHHREVVAMLDEIEARGTAIDIVFNNAAVQIAYREDYWKTPVEDFDLSESADRSPEETLIDKETAEAVERAVNRLAPQCRQVYTLKRQDQLSYIEIAEVLNVSVNTVKTQMKRAIKSLKKQLAGWMALVIAWLA